MINPNKFGLKLVFELYSYRYHVLIKKFVEKQPNVQVDLLKCHVMRGTGALVINALLDFFSYALCVPYSETTDSAHFDMLLEMLAGKLTVTIPLVPAVTMVTMETKILS